MAETVTNSDYLNRFQIVVGGKNVLKENLDRILDGIEDSSENQNRIQETISAELKEWRIRIGTIIKTDNLSFLLGAGTSLSSGGVSLVNIPKALEKTLLEKANQDIEKHRGLIELFYKATSILSETSLSYEDRLSLFTTKDIVEIEAINLNLESFLSQLHTWYAAITKGINSISLSNEVEISIDKTSLKCLIKELNTSLKNLLNLPARREVQENPLLSHRRFLRKILTRPLNLRRANVFTLNYDTLVEQAGDSEGVVLVDGFIGTMRRVFRPESYDIDYYFPAQTTEGRVHRFDRAIHLYKLHGSLNWHRCDAGWENPFGIYATYFDQDKNDDDVLIYPSPLKYGQALGLPYSELFRRFGNIIAQPQSSLFVLGYGFGDDHVNALIRQALSIPSFRLIVVDPSPKSPFISELEKLHDERVWIIKGLGLGTFEEFVDKLLPDLREEEIDIKVMETYTSMVNNASSDGDKGNDK